MLTLKNIVKTYGNAGILHGVSFSVKRGEKIGLVGPNGTGKSTILKIAAGLLAPDSGSVELSRAASAAYLGQEFSSAEKALTVREFVADGRGDFSGREAAVMIGKLGLPRDFLERRIGELSGGEKTKAGLIKIFIGRHDVYLLDEPTNNLDLPGLELLEKVISSSSSAFLIVSHDRMLLDRVVSKTLELDEFSRTVRVYDGGFSDYLRGREARIQKDRDKYEDFRLETKRLEQAIRRGKEWAANGNEAVNARDNDKFIVGKARDYAKGKAAAAKSIEKRLAKLEAVEKPQERLSLKLSFDEAERGSDAMFRCSAVTVGFGRKIFGPLDLEIDWGERIAVVGPNGAGKSLLAKLLAGEVSPVSGAVRRGQGLRLGYLPQEAFADLSKTALEEIADAVSDEEGILRRTLHRFRIDASDVAKPIAELSPGQRSRLVLAKLMLQRANCLLLDEPSNHLDLEALEVLEGALGSFKGTAIVITHDRYFIERFRPTRTLLCLPEWKFRQVDGNAVASA